jgi:hypothetical protein
MPIERFAYCRRNAGGLAVSRLFIKHGLVRSVVPVPCDFKERRGDLNRQISLAHCQRAPCAHPAAQQDFALNLCEAEGYRG